MAQRKKLQDEMDMLYLQALCGSALADRGEIFKFLWEIIRDLFEDLTPVIESDTFEEMRKEPKAPPAYKCYQVLIDLVEVNLAVLNGKDPSALVQTIKTTLEELGGGKNHLIIPGEITTLAEKQAAKFDVKKFTEHVLKDLSRLFSSDSFDLVLSICRCMTQWIWGRNYNFLHKMKNETVPPGLLESETRDYIDAGLLLNSPYFSVLREERDIDLIISLDFSEGDPFKTVNKTQKLCEELNIPFPEVNIPRGKEAKNPKDFYVFKGKNTPTVIHMPLFNVVNCGENIEAWRNKYDTIQGSYGHKKITDLMDIAGKNISNNREKLLEQIQAVIDRKRHE